MQKTIERIHNDIRMEGYEEVRQIAVQSNNEFEEKLGKEMED